eukprot:3939498-Rhodomonas_salina.3
MSTNHPTPCCLHSQRSWGILGWRTLPVPTPVLPLDPPPFPLFRRLLFRRQQQASDAPLLPLFDKPNVPPVPTKASGQPLPGDPSTSTHPLPCPSTSQTVPTTTFHRPVPTLSPPLPHQPPGFSRLRLAHPAASLQGAHTVLAPVTRRSSSQQVGLTPAGRIRPQQRRSQDQTAVAAALAFRLQSAVRDEMSPGHCERVIAKIDSFHERAFMIQGLSNWWLVATERQPRAEQEPRPGTAAVLVIRVGR